MNLPASWGDALELTRQRSRDSVVASGIAALLLWYSGALFFASFLFMKGIESGKVFAVLMVGSIVVLGVAGAGALIALIALLTGQRNRRLTTLALCINAAPFAWVVAAKMGLVWPYVQ